MPRILLIVATLMSVLLACASAELPRPSRQFAYSAQGTLLGYANGVRVFAAPDASGNLLQVDLRVPAGARNEPVMMAGLAHLSEHLLFQQVLPDGRTVAQALAAVSLGHNALTSHDDIHVTATTLPAHLEAVLGLYGFMLSGACVLSQEQFDRERNIVISELRERRTSGGYDEFLAAVFPRGHAYDHHIGGTPETLARVTADDVCRYLRDYFTPADALIIVAGAVTEDQVQAAASARLQPLPARQAKAPIPAPQAVFGAGARKTIAGASADRAVGLAFPFPPRDGDEALAARVLILLLNGQLATEAAGREEITSVGAGLIGGREAPVAVLLASVRDATNLSVAEDLLWDTIQSTDEMLRVSHGLEILRQRMRIEAATRVARLTTRGFVYADYMRHPEQGFLAGEIRRIDGLSPDTVRRLGSRLLARDAAMTLEVEPGPDPVVAPLRDVFVGSTERRRPDEGAPAIPESLLAETPDRVVRYELASGLEVVLAPTSAIPVVDIRLVFQAGYEHGPGDRPLTAALAATLLTPGSRDTESNKDLALLYASGAEIHVDVEARATTFITRGLSMYVDHLLRGLAAHVRRGQYSWSSLAEARRLLREWGERERRAADARPEPTGPGGVRELLRVGLNRCLEPDADLNALREYSARGLTEFHRAHHRIDRATLIVAGDFDVEIARAHIEDTLGRARSPADEQPPPSAAPRIGIAKHVVALSSQSVGRQVRVVTSFLLPRTLWSDRATALLVRELAEQAASGVRSQLGVSYGIHAVLTKLCGVEMLAIVGNVDPDHVEAGVEELRGGLLALRDPVRLAAMLPLAQRAVVGELLGESGDSGSVASHLAYLAAHDLPIDAFRAAARRVATMTPASVAPLLAAALDPRNQVTICEGPATSATACKQLDLRQ